MKRQMTRLAMLFGIAGVLLAIGLFVFATSATAEWVETDGDSTNVAPRYSHRLIVELETPPLVVASKDLPGARSGDGKVNARSAAAQTYMQQIQAEQAIVMANIQSVMPAAQFSTYINEEGAQIEQTYQLLINAIVVDTGVSAGAADDAQIEMLRKLPGVKNVYRDYYYYPQLYTSTHLINASMVWPSLGGQADAGRGIKIASMDGGLHKDAPMFSGDGFNYPAGYPEGGLGLTANNNGKIIASRAYFRPYDPPAPGDENPWAGVRGTSHGVHTASTAGGNVVTDAAFAGTSLPTMSGVAPGAWLGSYRVFYYSINGIETFATAEGLAALEDIVMDGMDVVNNSWGGGPGSVGGQFDALDTALINAVKAGVFVSMAAGNSGPNPGTGDHPSPDYINVAASTTSGTYASGRFSVSGPGTVISETLKNVAFAVASFGPSLSFGQVYTYTYLASVNVGDGSNFEGCNAWPAGTFTDKAAVISRGTCEFGLKVLNAQQAGAVYVVVYNTAAGGEGLINMSEGAFGAQVTIPSIFVGRNAGVGLVGWQSQHPADAQFSLDMFGFQLGSEPDVIANFSSRGPSTRNSLKPDIAAPGVAIMAQGYAPGVTGEARHLGYGQANGTSMAAPHVAGAAALLKQRYPMWTPADIKSALMSTSKYMDIYNANGSPAQPIDMGAGRLDVAAAMNPGVILMPPSADMGLVVTGTQETVAISVKNITDASETYTLTTLFTGNGFAPTQTTTLKGVTVSPAQLTLQPGQAATVTVTFNPAEGQGLDINQGYIVMQGDTHHAHMPFFARVVAGLGNAPILLIDADMSGPLPRANYAQYYTATMEALGVPYVYWNTAANLGTDLTLVNFGQLAQFQGIIIFTGDHYQPNGTFSVPTPLTARDMTLLNEYVQNGGTLMVMGQDFASVVNATSGNAPFFYAATLGATFLQDSVSNNSLTTAPVVPSNASPLAFRNIFLDLSGPNSALGKVSLTGLNEVPPITNTGKITGEATFLFDNFTDRLSYSIKIDVSEPFTLTNAHIHSGTVGVNGPVVHATFPFTQPQVVTNTITWSGAVVLTPEQQALREAGNLYLNIHTSANTGGEVRGQVPGMAVVGDGSGSQRFVDEISGAASLLRYAGANNLANGTVALANREQPTLENPGLSFLGKTLYTSFGLEGVNNGKGATTREELMSTFIKWAVDQPTVTISHTAEVTTSAVSQFSIQMSSIVTDSVPVSYRWDWGDGSPYSPVYPVPATPSSRVVQHSYAECGTYTVRVEVTNNYGNKAIGTKTVTVNACAAEPVYKSYLPNVAGSSE